MYVMINRRLRHDYCMVAMVTVISAYAAVLRKMDVTVVMRILFAGLCITLLTHYISQDSTDAHK